MKKIGRILKGVLKGVGTAAKDLLPVPTKAVKENFELKTRSILNADERIAALKTEALTSKAGSIAIIIYLINEVFELGLF